ncbi:MAG: hypothetical protein ACK2UW_05890 [Anaerolineales bacterium]|jgi:hypothetical protein
MEDHNGRHSATFNGRQLTVDKPAVYSIRVVGLLDKTWSDRLGGLQIDTGGREEKTAITTLTGPLIDQAALFGVLKALYDLRLPLLSVECLESY